jgi:hypothetical protein
MRHTSKNEWKVLGNILLHMKVRPERTFDLANDLVTSNIYFICFCFVHHHIAIPKRENQNLIFNKLNFLKLKAHEVTFHSRQILVPSQQVAGNVMLSVRSYVSSLHLCRSGLSVSLSVSIHVHRDRERDMYQ